MFSQLLRLKSGNKIFTIIYLLLSFSFFFYIIYKIYDPNLLYYGLQPFFAFDDYYFEFYGKLHLGNLIIGSNFILQYLFYPILGSAILSILFTTVVILYKRILKTKKTTYFVGLDLIIPILVLSSLKNYSTGVESLIILIVSGIILLINRLLESKHLSIKILFQLIIIGAIFIYIDPVLSFTVTVFLIVDDLLIYSGRRKLIPIILNLILVSVLVYFIIGTAQLPVIMQKISSSYKYTIISNYWLLIILHIALVTFLRFLSIIIKKIKQLEPILSNKLTQLSSLVILVILVIVFFSSLFQAPQKYEAEIGYNASLKRWHKIITQKKKLTIDDRECRFQLNRALFHTGKMPHSMFNYPQDWGEHTLFLTMQRDRGTTLPSSDLFFDMGFIKGSKYLALEAQTFYPYAPRVLIRMMQTSLLLNEIPVTNKYLSILYRSPIYHPYAKKIANQIEQNKTQELCNEWIGRDSVIAYPVGYIDSKAPNLDLIKILEADPENKMALEYLLSYYLLKNDLGNFVFYFKEYGDFPGKMIPRIYEEALIIYCMGNNISPEEFEYSIRKETQKDFYTFNKILMKYRQNKRNPKNELKKSFGHTYWYYLKYISPSTTGSEVKKKS